MDIRFSRAVGFLFILSFAIMGTNLGGCKETTSVLPSSSFFTETNIPVGTTTQIIGAVKLRSTKEGLANIPVSIWTQAGVQIGSGTLTTGEGKFFLNRPLPGLYVLDVATNSTLFVSVKYPVQVFADHTISPSTPEVLLDPISQGVASGENFLSGTVLLNTSKEALGGIDVDLYLKDLKIGETTKTTIEGKFFFSKPGPGLYTLHVASGSRTFDYTTFYVQILSDGTVSPAVPIVYIPRTPAGITVVTANATGTVLDAFSGAPLEYVTCILKGVGTQLTDLLGQFNFTGLLPGTYEIEFSKQSFSKMNVNFTVSPTGSITPATLTYSLIYKQETGKGSIGGRYVDETTRKGAENLSVRVYEMNYNTHFYPFPVSETLASGGTVTERKWETRSESNWEFSAPPFLIKSTHSGKTVSNIPDNAGTFKITHLPPSTAARTYFVFLGSDGATMNAVPRSVLGFITKWNVFDGVASHSWEQVPVSANTTTYLANYDKENY